MKRKKNVGKTVICFLAMLCFISGCLSLLYPDIKRAISGFELKQNLANFEIEKEQISEDVYKKIKAYNHQIYLEKQQGLKDAWSYSEPLFSKELQDIHMDTFGFIEIPRLDIKIPLYIGASAEHLRQGAAILSQTSMPIGGNSTNSVIAAHRGGFSGEALFRDIEKLQKNDEIKVTNPWKTLKYTVKKAIVISPQDINAVKIISNRDIVTLITCHPYPTDKQRYVVYCERYGEDKGEIIQSGVQYQHSQKRIDQEQSFHKLCITCIGLTIFFISVEKIVSKIKKICKERR